MSKQAETKKQAGVSQSRSSKLLGRHAIINIDSEEFKPETYRAVEVTIDLKKHKRYNSGIPQKDYDAALDEIKDRVEIISHSSSVDHFISDGGNLKA